MTHRLRKLLITGAAGRIGSVCRQRLGHIAETIRLTDLNDLGALAEHEEAVTCDLGIQEDVLSLVEGCDGVIHLAGFPNEADWHTLRHANFDAVVNLYEAVRLASGTPRVLFASSNHAIGFYQQSERLDESTLPRPNSMYGVSKVFGEGVASLYHDKFGIETAILRVGSCFPEPQNHRALATWLSYDDLIRLIECVFSVSVLGCPVIYGASNNDASWWDNSHVSYLGWKPRDNSEVFRAKLDAAQQPPASDDVRSIYQGADLCSPDRHLGDKA